MPSPFWQPNLTLPWEEIYLSGKWSNLLSKPLSLNQGQTTEYWIIPISSVPEAPRGHLITMKGKGSESTQKRRNRDQRPHGYTAPEGIVAPSWSSHWREGNLTHFKEGTPKCELFWGTGWVSVPLPQGLPGSKGLSSMLPSKEAMGMN